VSRRVICVFQGRELTIRIGYVELDDVSFVNKALSLSGTIVMGIPIAIQITEAERNREGQMEQAIAR
jgi:RNA-binding protein 39